MMKFPFQILSENKFIQVLLPSRQHKQLEVYAKGVKDIDL